MDKGLNRRFSKEDTQMAKKFSIKTVTLLYFTHLPSWFSTHTGAQLSRLFPMLLQNHM